MTKSRLQQILRSKIVLLLLFFGVVGFLAIQYQQGRQRKSVNTEIEHLRQQQQSFEQKNQELSQSLEYLTSADYKDRIARQQLGLKKNGEVVYNFSADIGDPGQPGSVAEENGDTSNLESWWLYLFHKKND